MNNGEKVLIKSNKGNYRIFTIALVVIGFLIFIPVFSEGIVNWYGDYHSIGYILTSDLPYYGSMTLLPFIVLAVIWHLWLSKMELTVSDKRAFGVAAFGKRVDLPLDSISAVGTSWLGGIDIGTSSGRIHFKFIKNNVEIHKQLSALLLERQQAKASSNVSAPVSAPAGADELKKYKDLLDSGVITQEEFDAKKKQLLGL